ncbi:probable RNA-binding protein EIF1AD [Sitophilus oryzae]|uniref:Probable RNA-binding protein EIF1AD n=1 Tax=Sitophilus oryzae TaxID=7048 RepID=A0A6J2YIY7_SITOR|nr:probable RNA-binding protein EIF1AD [Sitophilus oryzae]
MSRAVRRKHVLLEVFQDGFSTPTEDQRIVKVLSSPGNNLHEVEDSDGSKFLVSMPPKFRRTMWVIRGGYILIEPIKEGKKVKGEIVRILTKEQIQHFRKENVWPNAFKVDKNEEKHTDDILVNRNRPVIDSDTSSSSDSEDSSSEEDSEPEFVNRNRPVIQSDSSSSDDSDELFSEEDS